jgi:hypothetical protein
MNGPTRRDIIPSENHGPNRVRKQARIEEEP